MCQSLTLESLFAEKEIRTELHLEKLLLAKGTTFFLMKLLGSNLE